MNWLRHRIAHWLSWNYGINKSYWQDGHLFMSFVCSGCGQVSGVHDITYLVKVP